MPPSMGSSSKFNLSTNSQHSSQSIKIENCLDYNGGEKVIIGPTDPDEDRMKQEDITYDIVLKKEQEDYAEEDYNENDEDMNSNESHMKKLNTSGGIITSPNNLCDVRVTHTVVSSAKTLNTNNNNGIIVTPLNVENITVSPSSCRNQAERNDVMYSTEISVVNNSSNKIVENTKNNNDNNVTTVSSESFQSYMIIPDSRTMFSTVPAKELRKYHCTYPGCEKSYTRRFQLNQHILTHIITGPISCDAPNCSMKYFSEEDLKRHKLFKHSSANKDSCRQQDCTIPECDESYSEKHSEITTISSNVLPKSTEPVETRNTTSTTLNIQKNRTLPPIAPKSTISLPTNLIFRNVCTYPGCGKSYSSYSKLKLHLRSHKCEKYYVCRKPGCNATFTQFVPLPKPFILTASWDSEMKLLYVCPFKECGKAFTKRSKLHEHVCRHMGVRPFVCDKCKASFVQKYELRRHSIIHLRGAQPRSLSQCNKSYTRRYRLNLHISTHTGTGPISCDAPNCSMKYFSEEDLKRHKLSQHSSVDKDPRRRHTCTFPGCSRSYSELNKLKEHLRTHTGERPYVCRKPGCGATFARLSGVKSHEITHVYVRKRSKRLAQYPISMIECGKAFLKRNKFRDHIYRHTGVRPFVCDQCKASFVQKYELRCHTYVHLRVAQSINCEMSFYSRFNQMEHIRTHTGERPFTCPEPHCNSTFKRRRDLRDHWSMHLLDCPPSATLTEEEFNKALKEADEKYNAMYKYHCTYPGCDKSYARRHRLNQHISTHTGTGPIPCDAPNCNVRYFSEEDLKRHKLSHLYAADRDSRRRHACTYAGCGKAYSKLNKLKEHLRSHTGERPYVCREPGCGAAFIRLYGVKRHELTHVFGMRRPHICPFKECGKAFPKLNKLREHICRHTGERPFVCDKCKASFVRMYDLRRHSNIHLRGAQPRSLSRFLTTPQQTNETLESIIANNTTNPIISTVPVSINTLKVEEEPVLIRMEDITEQSTNVRPCDTNDQSYIMKQIPGVVGRNLQETLDLGSDKDWSIRSDQSILQNVSYDPNNSLNYLFSDAE
ncbi:putative zinc finger protein [Schistosoma mansoni]|uniref:putative zinc finger protein n=1 Tax=Schistosoma mansoni TaxID=6183 RepID=UPI0001A63C1A|nr:putative zinc finger protein [Schistosoma mansoni]|eukprot:XP_018653326.1 putative zinc finger protein [Schistosoma mansoni]